MVHNQSKLDCQATKLATIPWSVNALVHVRLSQLRLVWSKILADRKSREHRSYFWRRSTVGHKGTIGKSKERKLTFSPFFLTEVTHADASAAVQPEIIRKKSLSLANKFCQHERDRQPIDPFDPSIHSTRFLYFRRRPSEPIQPDQWNPRKTKNKRNKKKMDVHYTKYKNGSMIWPWQL